MSERESVDGLKRTRKVQGRMAVMKWKLLKKTQRIVGVENTDV